MKILAIDPGLKGGVAIFQDLELLRTTRTPLYKMPLSFSGKPKPQIDVLWLKQILMAECIMDFVTEYQTPMPGQSSVATATSFLNYGLVLSLRTLAVPHIVHPRVWKRHFGLGNDKKDAVAKAIHLFPILGTYVPSDGEAEAALMGYYWLEKGQGIARAHAYKASLPKPKRRKRKSLRKAGRGDAPSPAARTA